MDLSLVSESLLSVKKRRLFARYKISIDDSVLTLRGQHYGENGKQHACVPFNILKKVHSTWKIHYRIGTEARRDGRYIP